MGWLRALGWLTLRFGLAFINAFLHGVSENSLRAAGGILQLLGVTSVALGISKLRRDFGLPGMLAEVADETRKAALSAWRWFRLKVLRQSPPGITVTGNLSMSGSAVVRGRGKVGPGPDWNLDQRIAQLERLVDSLTDTVWKLEEEMGREVGELKQAISGERQAWGQAILDLNIRVKETAVGGVRLQAIGVVWLFAGVILATWSRELAGS